MRRVEEPGGPECGKVFQEPQEIHVWMMVGYHRNNPRTLVLLSHRVLDYPSRSPPCEGAGRRLTLYQGDHLQTL